MGRDWRSWSAAYRLCINEIFLKEKAVGKKRKKDERSAVGMVSKLCHK